METNLVKGLVLSDIDETYEVEVGQAFTKKTMPVSTDHIPKQSELLKWSHLADVKLPVIDAEVDLLLGSNVIDAYTPLDVRTGPSGSPYGTRTRLGWAIYGLCNSAIIAPQSHRTEVTAVEQLEVDKKLDNFMLKYLNMEFPEGPVEKRELSIEDKLFMTKVHESLVLKNGHYEMKLPFREDVLLPDNISQAKQRLLSLRRKMKSNAVFSKDYNDFMNKVLSNNFAEVVPEDEVTRADGRVWYIPHHGLYHPHKPGKMRVVFDCSATYQGISLNRLLLSGPDLTNNLLGVLVKFRQEITAIIGDIESMFYQVRVCKEDVDYLRFLWWPEGDFERVPKVYRMLVHIFGATSSPACANVALRQTAVDNVGEARKEVCDAVNHNFYVDDFLKATTTEEEAISMIEEVTELCSRGGFRLTKWFSNNRDVLKSVPSEERAKQYREVDIEKVDLPSERALGVGWDVESDSFIFKVTEQANFAVATRRSILSRIASVFDPLGFISPFILKGKQILQSLCRRGVSWDEDLTDADLDNWEKWEADLQELPRFSISRCLKPESFGTVMNCQVHHFSDASDVGYGVVTYVRLVNSEG